MTTATISEKPILFSGPMVLAILEGRKTQTRRVVQLDAELKHRGCKSLDGSWVDQGLGAGAYLKVPGPHETAHRLYCPYGYKGDRLWVRETFCQLAAHHRWDTSKPAEAMVNLGSRPMRNGIAYRAECGPESEEARQELGYKWKPSIFMRRWASRITLEICDVRVERLQSMTHMDWRADFAPSLNDLNRALETFKGDDNRREMSKALWDKINAARGFNWDSNPFVWVLEFRRVS